MKYNRLFRWIVKNSRFNPKNLWIGFLVGFLLLGALLTASFVLRTSNVQALQHFSQVERLLEKQLRQLDIIFGLFAPGTERNDAAIVLKVQKELDEYTERQVALKNLVIQSAERNSRLLNSSVLDEIDETSRRFVTYVTRKIEQLQAQNHQETQLAASRANGQSYNADIYSAASRKWLEDRLIRSHERLVDSLETHENERLARASFVANSFYIASIVLLLVEAVLILLPAHVVSTWHFQRSTRQKMHLRHMMRKLQSRNQDIQNAYDRIGHDALHDLQTGLANRRYLNQKLADLAAQYQSPSEQQNSGDRLAILHFDLDNFKALNDNFGHKVGDLVLVEMAKRFTTYMHKGDFIARVGGDEFVVLSYQLAMADNPVETLNTICEHLKVPVELDNAIWDCNFSVGVDFIDLDKIGQHTNIGNILSNVDLALYQAKKRGGGGFEVFTEALKVAHIQKQQFLEEIEAGFENEEFVPFYQIQYDAKTREPVAAEALVRWAHPTRGLLTPDAFLDEALSAGYGRQINNMVLQAAHEDAKVWKRVPNCPISKVAVNLDANSLEDPNFIDMLEKLDISPDLIAFEITETVNINRDAKKEIDQVAALKELGFEIEIDDFGTGHASILALQYLKPNYLKIDREFVFPIVEDPNQLRLVQSIIELSRPFDVKVVAEGVETLAHADILERIGCDVLQGYAFCKPIPAVSVLARINHAAGEQEAEQIAKSI